MKEQGKGGRTLLRGMVVLCTTACMLVFALPALANAPDPASTTVDQVTVNSDGSRTVTVEGTWTWATQTKCPTARNGVGYQVDWFDNTANAIGTAKDPNGILYVGDAQDNIVHSIETLGRSDAVGNAFWNGVPSSYVPGTAPTKTDAANWLSQCDNVNSAGVTAGHWGPISHTYAASFTGPITLCPVMYDPHGGHDNSGKSSVKDITAGANAGSKGYNDDNSYETNGTGPGPGTCAKIAVPTLTTSASSATAPDAIHDTATLTGSSGSGTITFKLYNAGSSCQGTPLFTDSVNTSGDGNYQSADFSPTSAGDYQWQASYSSSTIKNLLTQCNDPNEVSHVHRRTAGHPAISVVKAERIGSARFTHGPITGNVGDTVDYQMTVTNTGNTTLVIAFSDPQCDPGTLSGPTVVSGNYNGSTNTLSPRGVLQYTCTHVLASGDQPYTNVAAATGTAPNGVQVHGQDSVQAFANTPGINVLKLQRDGDSGAFTTGVLTITEHRNNYVVHTIEYEIQVTNTGNEPLTLTLNDPRCDAGTIQGPTVISGSLNGDVLSPGGEAQYTCSHRLLKSDSSTFTNVATVTGQPPAGPPVHGTSKVTVKKRTVSPVPKVCRTPSGRVIRYHGHKKPAACRRHKHHRPPSRRPHRPSGFTG